MGRSYRSPLTGMIREAHAACTESHATGVPIDEVTQMRAERARERQMGRRSVLKGVAAGVAVTGLTGLSRSAAAAQPRIVIVGGGLAGLRCAHKLWTRSKNRYSSTIYEWGD